MTFFSFVFRSFELNQLQNVYAMIYAVEEINRNNRLLPGMKVGYQIFDNCLSASWALQAALSSVGGEATSCTFVNKSATFKFNKQGNKKKVLFISYWSTCPCLSDRRLYPNFFRTIPSDIYQARTLARLAKHFKWTWIGAVVMQDDYGLGAIKVTVRGENIVTDAREAALTIQASTAKVIIIFAWFSVVRELFVTSSDLFQHPATSRVACGVFGVAIRSSTIDGFEAYIRGLHPSQRPDNEFLREYWEKEFGCAPVSSSSASLPPCNGTESLYGVHSRFTDMSQLRVTYNVYLAVYAAAHALHSLLSCPNTDTSTSNCSSPHQVTPGERFYFQGGDIPAKYDLVNWQKSPEGSLRLSLIGKVDGFDIDLNETGIQWSTGSSQVPVAVCSVSCAPGTRKAEKKGKPSCCFDCITCASGEISNKTDSLNCHRCPPEYWSNAKGTACIPRQQDFLSLDETLGITLTTVAVSGAVVTAAVFVVFLYYRQTPMVRANNSELSFLLLVSLKLCFLCSLVFIGRPSVWSCRFQQAAFGISFVLSISCLQVKTMVVLAAFRSTRPVAGMFVKWFGPRNQRGSIIICVVWLSVSPPEPHLDLSVQGPTVTLECAMESVLGFSLVLGYIGLLACTCLLLAFLARKLPDNFNEAKLITFSMLIFCAVWVAFVPAYVSSPGKYSVAVEIFAILASSYGLFIFAPKCYIILFKPEKNSKRHSAHARDKYNVTLRLYSL
uniref:G-protein coupled receptors family 3 profile domain-containing protein n=1 Tax=Neogobius melanostomus TaxID=47308 RepID=A0A8C6S5G8_9GOBI